MKSYVLDGSALVAFLRNEASAPKVGDLLKEALHGRIQVSMSAVNCGEVYGIILRLDGQQQAANALTVILPLPIQLVDATPQRCFRAAEIKVKYKLYYADSFAASLAIDQKATLVTCDSDFRIIGNSISILWLKN